ncbi:Rieske 2Fe-2S domain-containing protein [Sulfitobacter albidus]|uniref:Rieske 2Fe-2S domain-containing protein n=2 Tax=Sulfitobacter albidus TaxID=2829501 RepID=A0A975JHM7_9RHOB|nr:Rieske 2Fe-2S domain-containing protein [Sulfitobacter albidus]
MQICVSRAKSERLVLKLREARAGVTATRQPKARRRGGAADIRALVHAGQVHRDVYTSAEVYRLEMQHLFRNAWVFVGHESQTAQPGDYYTTQIGDQPVIQVRHSDGEIHVLHNRCPHKGTKIAIDREGNTGKFFRCPYHAWSFKTDGCLLAIPLAKGYDNTALNESENAKGMKAVGAVRNYRGFIFARVAEEGISFEAYFGDSLSSIDNMVDRAPAGRLEVAGPPLRYMHKCNWKMLVENQTDTCHPMVAHESSAGTAVKIWEEMGNPEPRPAAMQIIAPFMSPYEFFEDMGIRTWPNGHGHTGVNMSIHSDYDAIPGYFEALTEAYGAARAKEILDENRHNTVYFPNIMVKGPIQQLRNFIPLGPDKTLVESYIYRLVGAPDELLARTAMYNRMINAPTSIVGHDDLEMYERAQEGMMSDGLEWVDIQRLRTGPEDFSAEAIENGTTERQMRNQFDAWLTFMTADMQ